MIITYMGISQFPPTFKTNGQIEDFKILFLTTSNRKLEGMNTDI